MDTDATTARAAWRAARIAAMHANAAPGDRDGWPYRETPRTPPAPRCGCCETTTGPTTPHSCLIHR